MYGDGHELPSVLATGLTPRPLAPRAAGDEQVRPATRPLDRVGPASVILRVRGRRVGDRKRGQRNRDANGRPQSGSDRAGARARRSLFGHRPPRSYGRRGIEISPINFFARFGARRVSNELQAQKLLPITISQLIADQLREVSHHFVVIPRLYKLHLQHRRPARELYLVAAGVKADISYYL